MSRYLILLPAPEAEWADLPPEEHEKGHRSHEQFHAELQRRRAHPRDRRPAGALGRRRRRCGPAPTVTHW